MASSPTSMVDYPADDEKVIDYPYRASDRFLSDAEYSFYMVAKKTLTDRFIICPQVPLSAIFFVTAKQNYSSAFNKISRKRIDFLVCDGVTVKPLFGIELDDKSHERLDRIERDIFVERTFEVSGIPLLRIPVKNAYVTSDLELIFKGVLKSINWNPSQPGRIEPIPVAAKTLDNQTNIKICPKCGANMVIRVAKSGPRQGERFYGCINYPNCRTLIPLSQNEES